MMNVLEVTTTELNAILENVTMVQGMANIIGLTQFTAPKTTKKDRDTKEAFGGVINKLTNLSVLLNTEYETIVVNQLDREGKEDSDYKRGYNTMPIEKCDNNNFFGYYNGNAVIEYKPNAAVTPKTKYILDGRMTSKGKLPNVLPTTQKATNQGTDKEISWRKLYTKGIRRISINGQKYKVVNPS